jgi:hypothetical protein
MLARIPAKNADPLYPYVEAEDLLRRMVELFALLIQSASYPRSASSIDPDLKRDKRRQRFT